MLLPAIVSRGFGVHQVRKSWTNLISNSFQLWFRFWKLIWSSNIPDNPGSKSKSHRSCIWKVSFGKRRVSSTSGEKIVDKPDFEFISTQIALLKADLIFKYTWQSRIEIVEQLELHSKTQFRRAESGEIGAKTLKNALLSNEPKRHYDSSYLVLYYVLLYIFKS